MRRQWGHNIFVLLLLGGMFVFASQVKASFTPPSSWTCPQPESADRKYILWLRSDSDAVNEYGLPTSATVHCMDVSVGRTGVLYTELFETALFYEGNTPYRNNEKDPTQGGSMEHISVKDVNDPMVIGTIGYHSWPEQKVGDIKYDFVGVLSINGSSAYVRRRFRIEVEDGVIDMDTYLYFFKEFPYVAPSPAPTTPVQCACKLIVDGPTCTLSGMENFASGSSITVQQFMNLLPDTSTCDDLQQVSTLLPSKQVQIPTSCDVQASEKENSGHSFQIICSSLPSTGSCKCDDRCVKWGDPISPGSITGLVAGKGQCTVSGCTEYSDYAACLASIQKTTTSTVKDAKTVPFSFPSAATLNPLGTTNIPALLGRAISIVLGLLGSIALAVFLYGGFLWMTAMGSTERSGKALSTLLWGALGVIVIFASYAIINFVFKVLV